jgi:signal transduction histidine kinase
MKRLFTPPHFAPYFTVVLVVSAAAVLSAFHLNPLDFFVIASLEILSLILLRKAEARFSTKTIESLTRTNQTRLLIEYLGIPQKRALYLAGLGLVGDLPALLFLVTLSHQAPSLLLGLVWTSLSFLLNAALYCTRFNETTQYLTRVIQEAHAEMDLSDAVMRLKFDSETRNPHSRLYLNLIVLMGFILILPLYGLPLFHAKFDMLDLFLILTPGMLIFLNLWNQNREFASESFREMAKALSGFELEKKEIRLELSCSENNLRLAQAFYLMQRRVSCAESEITKILIEESDKRRFQFLGEIAGLVAHDLSGPLHAAHFYSEELLENPNHLKKDEFIKKLFTFFS